MVRTWRDDEDDSDDDDGRIRMDIAMEGQGKSETTKI